MSSRAAAARYARALFDIAREQGDPAAIGAELRAFAALPQQHAELAAVIANPVVPPRVKHGIVERLAGPLGLSPILRRLVALLAERDRLKILPELVEAYEARLREHQQIVQAEVVTAVPLTDDRAESLARSLGRLTGKRVSLVRRIDPTILGGVVTRIGSTVYDGSVARHLERLKAQMLERA